MWMALRTLGHKQNVTVLLTSDEEVGSNSSRELIEKEAGRAKAVLVLELALLLQPGVVADAQLVGLFQEGVRPRRVLGPGGRRAVVVGRGRGVAAGTGQGGPLHHRPLAGQRAGLGFVQKGLGGRPRADAGLRRSLVVTTGSSSGVCRAQVAPDYVVVVGSSSATALLLRLVSHQLIPGIPPNNFRS